MGAVLNCFPSDENAGITKPSSGGGILSVLNCFPNDDSQEDEVGDTKTDQQQEAGEKSTKEDQNTAAGETKENTVNEQKSGDAGEMKSETGKKEDALTPMNPQNVVPGKEVEENVDVLEITSVEEAVKPKGSEIEEDSQMTAPDSSMAEDSELGPAVPDFVITYQSRPYELEVDSSDYYTDAYISKIKNPEKNKNAVLGAQIILVGKVDVRGMNHKEILKRLMDEPLPSVIGFANPPTVDEEKKKVEADKDEKKDETAKQAEKYNEMAKEFLAKIKKEFDPEASTKYKSYTFVDSKSFGKTEIYKRNTSYIDDKVDGVPTWKCVVTFKDGDLNKVLGDMCNNELQIRNVKNLKCLERLQTNDKESFINYEVHYMPMSRTLNKRFYITLTNVNRIPDNKEKVIITVQSLDKNVQLAEFTQDKKLLSKNKKYYRGAMFKSIVLEQISEKQVKATMVMTLDLNGKVTKSHEKKFGADMVAYLENQQQIVSADPTTSAM